MGSRYTLNWGGFPVVAEVIEDRGPIGVRGRRLVRVRLIGEPGDVPGMDRTFGMPFEELTSTK